MRSTVPQRSRRGIIILLGALAVLLIAIFFGIYSRVQRTKEADLAEATEHAAAPVVNIIHPEAGAPDQELALPGQTVAFTDTPIYARTSGYLKHWYFDIGAHVAKANLWPDRDAELDAQLRQARADLETAQANLPPCRDHGEAQAKSAEEAIDRDAGRDNAVGAYNADRPSSIRNRPK